MSNSSRSLRSTTVAARSHNQRSLRPSPRRSERISPPDARHSQPQPHLCGLTWDEYTFGGALSAEEADRSGAVPGLEDVAMFMQSLAAVRRHLSRPFSAYHLRSSQVPKLRLPPPKARPSASLQDPRTIVFSALHLGNEWTLKPRYFSPLPEEYFATPSRQVWSCPACLKFFRSRAAYAHHAPKCLERAPPGQEIYRAADLSVFEVNGRLSVRYCQRLCLITKMFLDHKSVYYETETFLFYLLIRRTPFSPAPARHLGLSAALPRWQADQQQQLCRWHLVGYFSKEKASPQHYNLSCIMTFPQYQRCGYGSLLIDLSYWLSRREGQLGGPERPLSDAGLAGYLRYWTFAVLGFLRQCWEQEEGRGRCPALSIQDICQATGMVAEDVLLVLRRIDGLHERPRGQYVIDPPLAVLQSHRPLRVAIDPERLLWAPYRCTL